MFRFIHTADWQLGARFSQFGATGRVLREARLGTLAKTLALARQHKGRRPDSGDPLVVVPLDESGAPIQSGGWKDAVSSEDFAALMANWRSQNAGVPIPSQQSKPNQE